MFPWILLRKSRYHCSFIWSTHWSDWLTDCIIGYCFGTVQLFYFIKQVPGDNCYASIDNESDKRLSTNEPSKAAAIPWLRRSLDDEEPRYVNQTHSSDYETI